MTAAGPAPEVSVLVVGYNSMDHLPAAIAAIAPACAGHAFEVHFIENGEAASGAWLAAQHPAVIVHPPRGNIGFAAACNLLAEAARGRSRLPPPSRAMPSLAAPRSIRPAGRSLRAGSPFRRRRGWPGPCFPPPARARPSIPAPG